MNNDTVTGKLDQAAGKVKQGVGEAVGNQHLANEGAVDQVKGAAQETWGKVKDTAADVDDKARARTAADTHDTSHNLRDSITQGARNVKNSINKKLEDIKDNNRHTDRGRV